MSERKEHVVLNADIGRHLLVYLKGIDAINFIEAVHMDEQFYPIGRMYDHQFIKIFKRFTGHSRSLLPCTVFADFTDHWRIDHKRGTSDEKYYSDTLQPCLRRFVHECFTTEAFSALSQVYKTSLFKCYSRLLSYNSSAYNADFGLRNYEWHSSTLAGERKLSDHEMNLFRSKLQTIENQEIVHFFCCQFSKPLFSVISR